jgi:hypothetical protein
MQDRSFGMDDDKYTAMRDAASNPLQVARAAVADGRRVSEVMPMLVSVFEDLSLSQCKALYEYARGDVHSTREFIEPIREYIESLLDENTDSH